MKIGDIVTVVVRIPEAAATTEEKIKVARITNDKIYLEGLDIPFFRFTGVKTESFPGTLVYIKEIKLRLKVA